MRNCSIRNPQTPAERDEVILKYLRAAVHPSACLYCTPSVAVLTVPGACAAHRNMQWTHVIVALMNIMWIAFFLPPHLVPGKSFAFGVLNRKCSCKIMPPIIAHVSNIITQCRSIVLM